MCEKSATDLVSHRFLVPTEISRAKQRTEMSDSLSISRSGVSRRTFCVLEVEEHKAATSRTTPEETRQLEGFGTNQMLAGEHQIRNVS